MSESYLQLWHNVLTGDQRSWRQLVALLTPLVFSVARRTGLDVSDASDIAQQTWMDLYRTRTSIKEPERLPAWLARVAQRKSLRLIKRRIQQEDISLQLPETEQSLTPEQETDRLERVALLRLAIEQLDGRCRKLLEAAFFAEPEHSYVQIARELNLSINSIGPIRLRCLKRLRAILKEYGLE